MNIPTVAYLAVRGSVHEQELAAEYLKVLALLDPSCKHISLEDAARNYMHVRVTMEGNAQEDEKLITILRRDNDDLVVWVMELKKEIRLMREVMNAIREATAIA